MSTPTTAVPTNRETEVLRRNVTTQIDRLIAQLSDLELLRDALDEQEYEETRADTLEQMAEFSESLRRVQAGEVSLLDEFGAIRMAMQAAISSAFKTPEVIRLFARRETDELRLHLKNLKRDLRLGKFAATADIVEVLVALRKLGETLDPSDEEFLRLNTTDNLEQFQKLDIDSLDDDRSLFMSMVESKLAAAPQK